MEKVRTHVSFLHSLLEDLDSNSEPELNLENVTEGHNRQHSVQESLAYNLQSGMANFRIIPDDTIINKPPFQPVFRKKLLAPFHDMKRCESNDSLETTLSLLSISTDEDSVEEKRPHTEHGMSNKISWSDVDRMMKNSSRNFLERYVHMENVKIMDTYADQNEHESIAFKLFDEDDQKALIQTRFTRGIRLTSGMQKSKSSTNINESPKRTMSRPGSAGATPTSEPLDVEGIRRLIHYRKVLTLQQRNKISFEMTRRGSHFSRDSVLSYVKSSTSLNTQEQERNLLWKGDSQILQMDLESGLADKARQKVKDSNIAIDKETGFGEAVKEYKVLIGSHKEFPMHVEDDYAFYPRIIQKMRISPDLAKFIKKDIKERMGRPRYHEIRERDVEVWDSNQNLGRYQRNLKIFNWLQSLSEEDFERDVTPPLIEDNISRDDDIVHIESVDELDEKPLHLKDFSIR